MAQRTGKQFNPNVLTLGFARRVATYKRASLLFSDPKRLAKIAKKIGGLQILFAGKAHPADAAGKGLIRDVFTAAASLKVDSVNMLYLENYDWELGALLTQGVDVWVNTPLRPYEASGTSGMKAALNGVPSLSVLDGWWIEGCAENLTGWAIEGPTPRTARPPAYTTSWRTSSRRSTNGPTHGRACSSTASESTAPSSTPTACWGSTSPTPTSRRSLPKKPSPSRPICGQPPQYPSTEQSAKPSVAKKSKLPAPAPESAPPLQETTPA